MQTISIKRALVFLLPLLVTLMYQCTVALAQEQIPELEEIKNDIEELLKKDFENQRKLEELRRRVKALQRQADEGSEVVQEESPLDRAIEALDGEKEETPLDEALKEVTEEQPASGDLWSRNLGAVNLRLIDLSADLLFAVGSSTERDESLESLQGGGHDPRKRGFTLQNLELSLMGAVDPYFNVETHIIYFIGPDGESEFELEEAFLTTQQLPFGLEEYGLQLEAGQFFTEFGRINPRHPHEWSWLDQPVVNTRFFGPDGMRGPGFRVGWLTPLPWFSELHLGMQNANGETMSSFLANEEFFEERPIGGRPFVDREVRSLKDLVYLARLDNSWDWHDELTSKFGVSGLAGPNATGSDGSTFIYGLDFLLKWRPVKNDHGWPFVLWQSEIMKRDYKADSFFDEGDPLDPADDINLTGTTLREWGFYSQVLYGFSRNWAAGFRYEYASGRGDSVGEFASRKEDPFRDDRQRLSPLMVWQPTEFSRIRLQYNYDVADHLEDNDAHSVWLGFEVLFGKHPAHTY